MTRTPAGLRRLLALAAAAVTVTTLAACGTTENATGSDPTAAGSTSSGPITVTDDRGETVTLDAPATKVVSLEWGTTEQVVALGVMPVGVADVKGYGNWVTAAELDDSVTDVGTRGEPSLDAIGGLAPDLIVAVTDTAGTTLDQLEQLAPVIVVAGNDPTDPIGHMEDTTRMIATALGKDAEADQLMDTFQTSIDTAKSSLADAGLDGAPVTVSDGYQEGSAVSLRIFTETSYWGGLLTAMGVTPTWSAEGDEVYGLAQTDVEGLTALTDPDLRFLYIANDQDGGDVYTGALADNPVWKGLPFVEAGNVARIPDGTWSFGGPLSGAQFAERATSLLTASA